MLEKKRLANKIVDDYNANRTRNIKTRNIKTLSRLRSNEKLKTARNKIIEADALYEEFNADKDTRSKYYKKLSIKPGKNHALLKRGLE